MYARRHAISKRELACCPCFNSSRRATGVHRRCGHFSPPAPATGELLAARGGVCARRRNCPFGRECHKRVITPVCMACFDVVRSGKRAAVESKGPPVVMNGGFHLRGCHGRQRRVYHGQAGARAILVVARDPCWLCASLAALRGREKGQGSQQHDISGENRKTSVSLLRRQLQRGTHLSTRGPLGKRFLLSQLPCYSTEMASLHGALWNAIAILLKNMA